MKPVEGGQKRCARSQKEGTDGVDVWSIKRQSCGDGHHMMNLHAGEFRSSDASDAPAISDPAEIKTLSCAVDAAIGRPVLGVSGIEGRADSMRVKVSDGTLIATPREDQRELKREATMLRKLWKVGAPVPRAIATGDGFLFEEDLGGRSLTSLLATAGDRRRHQLMESAFEGLYQIKSVARRARFKNPPPLFRSDPDWLKRFVSSPRLLSEFLKISQPPLSESGMLRALEFRASRFVKWGASPCNALVCEKGSVCWFDWRTAGLGAGYEDIGFLISDENWPFEPTASLALYRRYQWDWSPRAEANLCMFAMLRTCHRLLSICQENQKDVSMQVVRRLAAHGAAFAKRSVVTRGAEPWFDSLASEQVWNELLPTLNSYD